MVHVVKYGDFEKRYRLEQGMLLVNDELEDMTIWHKFGHNAAVGTTFVPIVEGGLWQRPQVAQASPLRVKAGGNAADTAGGAGGRKIRLFGLNGLGNEITEDIALAGASVSAQTTQSFLRLVRAYVIESGTYTAPSHIATITIEDIVGVQWGLIALNGYAASQTQIGALSTPQGFTDYVYDIKFSVESTKVVDLLIVLHAGMLKTAAPYEAARIHAELKGVEGFMPFVHDKKPLMVSAGTDFVILGKTAAGTADVSVQFDTIRSKVQPD